MPFRSRCARLLITVVIANTCVVAGCSTPPFAGHDGGAQDPGRDATADAAEDNVPGEIRVLVHGLVAPVALALFGDHLYFTDDQSGSLDGRIWRVSKAGGTPELLADGQNHVWRLAVDGTHVYWPADGVRRVGVSGGQVEVVDASVQLNWHSQLQMRGDKLFYLHLTNDGTQASGGQLVGLNVEDLSKHAVASTRGAAHVFAPLADGQWAVAEESSSHVQVVQVATDEAPKPLAPKEEGQIQDMVFDGRCLWWTNDVASRVNRVCDLRPGIASTPELVLAAPRVVGLAADERHVYGAAYDDGFIWRAPIAGGAAEVLIRDTQGVNRLRVDERHVYWINQGDGTIKRRLKD